MVSLMRLLMLKALLAVPPAVAGDVAGVEGRAFAARPVGRIARVVAFARRLLVRRSPDAKSPFAGRASHRAPLLVAGDDVRDLGQGRHVALDDCPWLRMAVDGSALAGHWVRLTYRSGLLDPLVRPIVRCVGEGSEDEYLPAALFGRAVWLGWIPAGTTEVWISPIDRAGPFAFAVERLDVLDDADIAAALLQRSPFHCLLWAVATVAGFDYAARMQVRRTLSATPLSGYDRWRRSRTRPLLDNFDGTESRWGEGAHIVVLVRAQRGDEGVVADLLSQMERQPYPHWTLAVVRPDLWDTPAEPDASRRMLWLTADQSDAAILAERADGDLVMPFRPTDRLPPYALAVVAGDAAAHPEVEAFFGDEDHIDPDGRYCDPRLNCDWSPIHPLLRDRDAPVVLRIGAVRQGGHGSLAALSDRLGSASASTAEGRLRARHIRRVLRTRQTTPLVPSPALGASETVAALPAAATGAPPVATIIIPSKNQPRLLRRCVESLRAHTRLSAVEIIIVDNGSTRRLVKTLLRELARDSRFSIVSAPGRFNFSSLCNRAAALATSPTLVFLNDDTECLTDGWLEPLLDWAGRPEIGAVGAKLLYPSGRVQHAGIVLGRDGRAGHCETQLAKDEAGFFGRLCVPHEVSAVTGACLAIEKAKFDAVGGFDEVNLPVELNDVDLCLRLAERGWKSVFVPQSLLIHRESASRGVSLRPDERYGVERRFFRSRWKKEIRDDPNFHPALSLDSIEIALG